MWTFLALVTAVVALVVAKRAKDDVRELRQWLAFHNVGVGAAAPQVAAAPPVVSEPPAPPPVAREPEPEIPIWQPPPPPAPIHESPITHHEPEPVAAFEAAPPLPPTPPPAAPPAPPAAPPKPPFWSQVDWESFVGVKLFSWVAGVALVIAAIYFLKYSVDHGWISPPIRAAIGLIAGSALLVICELRVARNYKFTANAMHGAGIAILFATLFAVHALWHLLPAMVVFGGMLIVTAVAVLLSIRRESLFIALLGMMGGFATPALLSTGENRPVGLFSYLLLLNAGLAWVAYKKRWPALTIGTVLFSVVYQWAWIGKFLDVAQLPLAAGVFLVFGIAAAAALWLRRDDAQQRVFDRMGQLGAAMPLLFALFAAAVPAYGARFNILFGFLLLMAAGLGIIAMLRNLEWLHAIGAVATLLTFAIWLSVSYTPDAWPLVLAWASAFVLLYLGIGTRFRSRVVICGAAMLFVVPTLIQLEPRTASPALAFSVLFVLLVLAAAYALRYEDGLVYYVGAFFAIVAEALWSVKHLNAERLYEGLAIYTVFGLLFLGVPALARRFNRALLPENGVSVTVLVSVAMLLFLTGDRIASGALWGLALLLAVLLVGAMAQARFTRRPIFAAIAVILAWIVLASWWEAASLEAALIPALFVIAVFGVLVVLTTAWARFEGQTHLALAGHAFLIFVAASRTLAFPPWPFLAVLLVLDLALGIAAVYLKRASLLIGGAILSQLVLFVWAILADVAPWPNVALAATLGVAAWAIGMSVLLSRRSAAKGLPHGSVEDPSASLRMTPAFIALILGHIVALMAGAIAATPPFATLLATHAVLVIATLVLAARTEQHWVAVASVALTAAATLAADTSSPAQLFTFAAVLYALYVAYPLALGARAKRALEPYLAAVAASIPFFFFGRDAMHDAGLDWMIGVLPVGQALVMLVLVVRLRGIEAQLTRLAIVAATALAFLTVAVPLQLEKQWITIAWALEGAALAWLYRRIPHRGLLAWGAALLAAVFVRLTINPDVLSYHPPSARAILNWYLYTYLVSSIAFFAAAQLAPREYKRAIGALRAAGTLLLFFLVNIEIADYFSSGSTLTFNVLSSSLAQDLTYTIGWAVFAIVMLIAGIALHTRAARVAAIALLVVTIFKCFIHDLARLGGLYRIASFLGLAFALVMVSVLLQKFVLARRTAPEEVAP
jgi:hypothetical protein